MKVVFSSNFGVPPKIHPDLRTRYFLELILGGMTSTKWPELEVRLGWFFFQTKKNNYPSWELTYPLKKAHVKMIFLGYPPCQSFKTITGFPLPPLPKKNCANHFSSTPPPTPTPSPQITQVQKSQASLCCAGAMVQCFIQVGGSKSTGAEFSSSMVAAVRVKAVMSSFIAHGEARGKFLMVSQ